MDKVYNKRLIEKEMKLVQNINPLFIELEYELENYYKKMYPEELIYIYIAFINIDIERNKIDVKLIVKELYI